MFNTNLTSLEILISKHFHWIYFFRNSLNWNTIPTLINVRNPPPELTPKRQVPRERTTESHKKCKVSTIEN